VAVSGSDRDELERVRELVAAERARASSPDAARDAAQEAVRGNLAALLANAPAPLSPGTQSESPRLFTRGQVGALGGALFGIGVAIGAVGGRGEHLEARPVPVPVASVAPVPDPPPAGSVIVEAPPSVAPSATVSPPAKAQASARPAVVTSTEDALIDAAREALARGIPAEALAATDEHARRYPAGALTEEREALAIQALVALGRRREAGNRAGEFRKRWPDSLLRRAVDRSLE
jgi:hypothetical protein